MHTAVRLNPKAGSSDMAAGLFSCRVQLSSFSCHAFPGISKECSPWQTQSLPIWQSQVGPGLTSQNATMIWAPGLHTLAWQGHTSWNGHLSTCTTPHKPFSAVALVCLSGPSIISTHGTHCCKAVQVRVINCLGSFIVGNPVCQPGVMTLQAWFGW